MSDADHTPAFWQHQLTRGPRLTPRAREELIIHRPRKMTEDERIRVATDPEAVVRAMRHRVLPKEDNRC